jgi:pyridoxal 5'-phosphate synthase pdxS subunit
MIRTKGEAGTGDVVHAVQHMRQITSEMRALTVLSEQELYKAAKDHQAPYELIRMVAQTGKLPVPNFSAGGIATPADAALMMQLGAEAIFVGSGIFMKERATPLDVENPLTKLAFVQGKRTPRSAKKPSPAPRPSSRPPPTTTIPRS